MTRWSILIWQFTLLVLFWPGFSEAGDRRTMTPDERKDATLEKFKGINFGLGIGVVGIPSKRLAKSAQVVNGVVRVDNAEDLSASILLESHYFFTDKCTPRFGHGPFVAIRSGGSENQIIDAIGIGYMIGGRYDAEANSSWNIGIGLSVNPSARVLGDGITKNAPLPAGETEIRTQSKSLLGFMVLVSFSWNTFEPNFTKLVP